MTTIKKRQAIREALVAKISNAQHEYGYEAGGVQNELEEFLAEKWEEVEESLRSKGIPKGNIPEGYPAIVRKKVGARRMRDKFDKGVGTMVTCGSDHYKLRPLGGKTRRVDEMPEPLQAPLGFMKMQDIGTLVPGVGYRLSEVDFYLVEVVK